MYKENDPLKRDLQSLIGDFSDFKIKLEDLITNITLDERESILLQVTMSKIENILFHWDTKLNTPTLKLEHTISLRELCKTCDNYNFAAAVDKLLICLKNSEFGKVKNNNYQFFFAGTMQTIDDYALTKAQCLTLVAKMNDKFLIEVVEHWCNIEKRS